MACTYTYDAENRIATVDGERLYAYDAEGQRVAKYTSAGVTNSYLLGLGGEQVTELDGTGKWLHTNVYAGGTLLATYSASGQSNPGYHFHLTDWLGTRRVSTDASGNMEESCTSYPFGDDLSCAGDSDPTEQHFTGKERDVESGLDYFGARYLSSNMGRFMTPDWAASPTDVPYASFGDPQTLNLYAYVRNNPIIGKDLDGHDSNDATFEMSAWELGYQEYIDDDEPHENVTINDDESEAVSNQQQNDNTDQQTNATPPADSTQVAQNNTPTPPGQPQPQNQQPAPKNPAPSVCPPGTTATTQKMLVTGYDNSYQSTGKNPGDPGYGKTASGTTAGPGTVAAPSKYPFGTVMNIPGYGTGTVSDRGGAIKNAHIDLWFPTTRQAINWGAQHLTVTVCLPQQ